MEMRPGAAGSSLCWLGMRVAGSMGADAWGLVAVCWKRELAKVICR